MVFFRTAASAQRKENAMNQTKTTTEKRPSSDGAAGRDELRKSPMMAHLLDALEAGTDVGHYGRLVFAMVARHFLDEDELVRLLAAQPGEDETKARAMVLQVKQRDYSPPRRERILEWQAHQDFPIIPNPDDPDEGNLYRDLRFPEGIYEHINEYYQEKAESEEAKE
jgi:hypothetical protein